MDFGGPQGDVLRRLLTTCSLRSRILAANVANQNTPGYRRREVSFEDALVKALDRGRDVSGLRPEVVEDLAAPVGADGNSVDMENEVSAARENRMLFELYANILEGRSRLVEMAMREGH